MNASEFIYGSLHFFDPILNAEFSPQGIALRQFTTRWEGGMVRTSGNWLRSNKAMVLDDAAIVGLEYTLPENWKQQWMKPLPTWLNSLTLKKFSASRNLVIDIDRVSRGSSPRLTVTALTSGWYRTISGGSGAGAPPSTPLLLPLTARMYVVLRWR